MRNALKQSYFCPYTQNKKFETFIGDLLELNLPQQRTQEEIVHFVSLIETFYCDRISQLLKNERKRERTVRRERGLQAKRISDKNELEQAFLDSIEQTKANIEKRRLFQHEKLNTRGRKTERQSHSNSRTRIGLKDFAAYDKESLLELFLANPSTIRHMYQSIFGDLQRHQGNTAIGSGQDL